MSKSAEWAAQDEQVRLNLRGSRVVIKREKSSDRLGLIWIPDRARKHTLEGVVTHVGHQVKTLEYGDRVLFPSRAWSPFSLLGPDYVLVREEEVLAVLERGRA